MPFQFLAEVVAEFYDFSAFSPFLTFDCVNYVVAYLNKVNVQRNNL